MNTNSIKCIGRYSVSNNHYFFYNGGSGFSFKMRGSGFTVAFKSKPREGYFYIVVDRDYENKTKVLANDESYRFSLLDSKDHYVDILKANEANDNTFELVDFTVDGELLEYDHHYEKTVRVFGDSTIAGFGILAKTGNASIHNSDSVQDFCYHALYEMNMDVDVLSASGYGLTFSAYTCPKNIGIIDYVDKVSTSSQKAWKNTKCDLLIVSLGCNDNSFIQEQPNLKEENIKKFKEAYQSLIDSQIKLNKDLKVLMVYGTLNEKDAYYLYEETYKYLKPMYKNLYIHKFNGDSSAISNHAYVTAHNSMAEELKAVIKDILK